MKSTALLFAAIATALCGFLFSGCASMDADRESLLSAAGFVSRTPETAKQRELYAAAPAYKLQRGTVNGKVFYAYKDEKKGVAWVGDEAAYQRYHKLAVQRQIAEDQLAAAEMNSYASWGWYGTYYQPYYPMHPIHPIRPIPHPMPRPMPRVR
jgi:hypothetical protein